MLAEDPSGFDPVDLACVKRDFIVAADACNQKAFPALSLSDQRRIPDLFLGRMLFS